MKTLIPFTALAVLAASGISRAETALSNPSGYTTIVCPANSDTVVGLPLRTSADFAAALSSVPAVSGGNATLTVGDGLSGSFGNTHYVKFSSGSEVGNFFPVVSNNSTSLTVSLNGGAITATQGDRFEVIKFWTLGELFNPTEATTDPVTTPNAVVASTNVLGSGRRTEILLPDQVSRGINLAPSSIFFIQGGAWRKVGVSGDFSATQLWPDAYFVIRHTAAVTQGTKYIATGQVEMSSILVPLTTRTNGKQDNFVGIPRPVDVKLDDLGLKGSPAFTSSTNVLGSGRRDELLLFDNTTVGKNKAAATIYFVIDSQWRKVGSADNAGQDVVPAGTGFIIRKHPRTNGDTVFWRNTAPYAASN